MSGLLLAVSAAAGYLIGCFSTGVSVSRERNIDIRSLGSRSTGATNVTRVMGIRMGAITFLGDFAKAVLAVLLGRAVAGEGGALVAGLAAVIGHNWPVFYHFRGGKGIACSMAVLLMVSPVWALLSYAVAALVVLLTRYVSLGSLTLLLVSTVSAFAVRGAWPYGIWTLSLLLLGLFRHRANLQRLAAGTENRFSLGGDRRKK